MTIALSRESQIHTDRLLLRPSTTEDAQRGFEILSDWEVSKMLRMVSYPIDQEGNAAWFAGHESEWAEGTAYRFAVILQNRMIGLIDIDEIDDGGGSLGYWFERECWGRGLAREAAFAIKRFAFESINLQNLRSGHAADNEGSGKILTALGFQHVGNKMIPSRSRKSEIEQCRYLLSR